LPDRKRERSYCRLLKQSRKTKITCCQLVLSFILLTGCAGHKKIQRGTQPLDQINRICFNSEGKGRIETPEGKYVFNYETALDKENYRWSFAFHFPLGRQEILHLNYYPTPKAGGMFFRKISQSLKVSDRKQLNEFLEFIALLAKVKHFQKDNQKLILDNSADSYFLRLNEKGSSAPFLALSQLDEHFQKIIIRYENEEKSNLKLLLFHSSCVAS
jgi:hypothetical protein